jgi:hypothetical protein
MHVPINVKSPNNISKWHMGFNSAFKGLTSCTAHEHWNTATDKCSLRTRMQGMCDALTLRMVVCWRRFGTRYRSHLSGSIGLKKPVKQVTNGALICAVAGTNWPTANFLPQKPYAVTLPSHVQPCPTQGPQQKFHNLLTKAIYYRFLFTTVGPAASIRLQLP